MPSRCVPIPMSSIFISTFRSNPKGAHTEVARQHWASNHRSLRATEPEREDRHAQVVLSSRTRSALTRMCAVARGVY
jgi:hypothetical protein